MLMITSGRGSAPFEAMAETSKSKGGTVDQQKQSFQTLRIMTMIEPVVHREPSLSRLRNPKTPNNGTLSIGSYV